METEKLAAAIESVRVMSLRRDDVIVLKCEGIMSDETANRIRRALENRFAHNKILILSNGLDLSIISKAEAERVAA